MRAAPLLIAAIGACGGERRAEPAGRPAARVALGERFSCAIRPDGSIWCWGEGDDGELGAGSGAPIARRPVQVPGIAGATDLAAARFYACAVVAGGSVWCWGEDGFGRVSGRPGVFGPQAPRLVDGVTDVVRVATGEYHACALRRDGAVWCWGRNTSGELGFRGIESKASEMHVAAAVPGLGHATDLAAFGTRTCAVQDGQILCWGRGATRIADDGSSGSIPREPASDEEIPPKRIAGIDHAKRIFVAHYHACALRDDASLWCWGDNQCSQSEPGDASAAVTAPVRVAEHVATAAVGNGVTCIALASGEVQCWGCGGTLGDGEHRHERPAPVPGVSAVDLSIGSGHACAIASDGRAWCWGSNYNGKLGAGLAIDDDVPVATPVAW